MPSPTEHLQPAAAGPKGSTAFATPRATARMRRLTAGFLALGSSPLATFPVSQWYLGHRLSDYSCGGSRGLTAFPFDPLAWGTLARLIRAAAKARQWGSGRLEGGRPGAPCAVMSAQIADSAPHRAKMANPKAAQHARGAA